MAFKILAEDGNARTGLLKTMHGNISTPFYMPVGTKASIKNLSPEMLAATGTECIIANSFVLSLRPGVEVIRTHGGIHKFMNWPKGIFTDCGGFQAGSESFFVSMSDAGIRFKNPYDGKLMTLSPEDSVRIQEDIGSDVAMCLDDMPHPTWQHSKVKESVDRTHAWAARCLSAKKDNKQLLFGISQGGVYRDLREFSAKTIDALGFDGIAIGGLAIGETKAQMHDALTAALPFCSKEKPRYVMGLGSPEDMVAAVGMGIDCFDSIYATQTARRGGILTLTGRLNIKNAAFKRDNHPLENGCDCYACKKFSRAYVHHLLEVYENFGFTLASIHNIRFMQRLLAGLREAIKKERFGEFKTEFLKSYLSK
jgi:queuine tRNA-ribosyltransferase